MKKRIVLVVVLLLFARQGTIAAAEENADARIEKLEAQLQAMQAEIAKLKTAKAAPAVSKKQVETMLDKILAERPQPERGPLDFRVFWKEGLRFESLDKNFKLKFGGRIMNDWAWMDADSSVEKSKGNAMDGTEFRRVRLYISGLMYGNVDYKLQFDFAGGKAKLKDAFIGIRGLRFGYLKMGHFKEPFGLEELTSSKYTTFIERALPMAFAPSRNNGIMLSSTAFNKRMTWAAGVFKDTDSYGKSTTGSGYNVTARVTALPWYKDKGAKLLHMGLAYSLRNQKNTVRYRQRPEAHLAPYFVDTTALNSNRANLLGAESALVYGPFSLQGEYVMANVDRSSGSSDPTFDGFYLQGSYFLTGEHRRYKKSSGAFGRVKPKKNFSSKDGGAGAWEIATRYSQIDLSSGGVGGGKLKNITVGLNWYLNPNMRIMWNYIRSKLDGVGSSDLALMRFQIDF